tara:strand:- start:51 stop:581 length:531 start_codon:yes stop_codon:yes gene_type:complete
LLIEGCVASMKTLIEDTRVQIEELMKTHPTSVHIKNLQSLNLQYAVTAVGIFSIFEADLQRELEADDGFRAVRALLIERDESELLERFDLFKHAINVLKHGAGRSYDALRQFDGSLPFLLKSSDQESFDEGDCTEIDTLILADDEFVSNCAEIVYQVSDFVFDVKHPGRDDRFRDN